MPQQPSDLWYGTRGRPDAPIVLVGESWGAEEEREKRPFVGTSGTELSRILAEAGISESEILFTNMAAVRPQQNETYRLFEPKVSKPQRIGGLAPSNFIKSELKRLYTQIASYPRRLVITTGNWSFWALSQKTSQKILTTANDRAIPKELQTWAPSGIMDWRGSMLYVEPHQAFLGSGDMEATLRKTPLLPTIHPAAIMRAWYLRQVTVHDYKQRVPQAPSDWRPNPPPKTYSPPAFEIAKDILINWLFRADRGIEVFIAADVETVRRRFISVVGLADDYLAMCIPFVQRDNPDGSIESYWSIEQEATLIKLIRRLVTHPLIKIEGQNFIYDTQYFQEWLGVTPRLDFDTMLAQNVLFPGTPKDLGYLSSLYCRYHWYWKEDNKDWDMVGDLQRLMDYNCVDVWRTREIATSQRLLISQLGQDWQWDFKMKVNSLCLRMMNRGIAIDQKRRGSMLFTLQQAIAGYQSELLRIIPQEWHLEYMDTGSKKMWYASAQQTAHLFYQTLGFKVVKHPKTGRPTVGKPALAQLKRWYPEFWGLFERLDMLGSTENSAEVVQMKLDPRGRAACSYNPGGTETHRLSSSISAFGYGTNLQNLTKGEEDD